MRYRGSKIMRFREGICINCKHELQIDTNKKTSTCPFCGINYDVIKTIDNKEQLLEEKKNLKFKNEETGSENVKVEKKQNITSNGAKSSQTWIFIAIIVMIIGSCIILAFVYPKQNDNGIVNSYNIETESILPETTINEVNSGTDNNKKDIVESEDSQYIKSEKPQEEQDKKVTTESQGLDNGFKLGENPTASNLDENETTLLFNKTIPIIKILILLNLVIGLIRFIIAILDEDTEGTSEASRFLILSALMMIFISTIVSLIR